MQRIATKESLKQVRLLLYPEYYLNVEFGDSLSLLKRRILTDEVKHITVTSIHL